MKIDALMGKRARKILLEASFSLFVLALIFFAFRSYAPTNFAIVQGVSASRVFGLILIFFGVFLGLGLVEFFYTSSLVSGKVFGRGGKEYIFGLEALWMLGSDGEVYHNLIRRQFGKFLALRLGIPYETLKNFCRERGTPPDFLKKVADFADRGKSALVRAPDLLEILWEADKNFAELFFGLTVKKEELLGAAAWVGKELESEATRSRWWERGNLSRIPGIAKDFGFGYTFTLDDYSREVLASQAPFAQETREEEIEKIESVLARSYEANLILVGEEGTGKHVILEGLARRIASGSVVSALEHKRLCVLDYQSMSATSKSKPNYEALTIKIFNEAVRAGNIIIVLEDFPDFLASSSALGVDVLTLLEPYLSGSRIQMIALSDKARFHRDLEPVGKISKLFEKIELEEPSSERLMRMLEDVASSIEARARKIFTYQAIVVALELADRYITEGAMPEKAIDLLDETVSGTVASIIYREDVERIVERRTHIPTEKAKGEEREKLLHLEELLHTRMINQDQAIKQVANALRRARSGLKGTTRPIGSFLFLGPTGVGKTETAKALAEMYFGGAANMSRFDMSEFQGEDGLKKLAGAYGSKEPGALAVKLREKPFSLLLFDEFEKASREIHNLFLQILDEGFFSDAAGKKVSARETMIIATSNAGAATIIDLLKAGKDPAEIQDTVVDAVRTQNIFTPELLNRFDAVVVYHPLKPAELEEVATLLLKELALRLEVQEIHFKPSKELAKKIVEIGYDPLNGARPMRRAIADRVEQVIAKKILEGSLNRGDSFSFSKEEITAL